MSNVSQRSYSMRRLSGLGVILSIGLITACSSTTSPPGGSGGAGGSTGAGGAAAGTTGQGGAGGAAGQGAGGAAGQGAGGAAGQGAGGAAGQGAGGAAGQGAGGAAGQGAGGAAGGGAVTCLDPSMFSSSFAIADSTFCAVAIYTASEAIGYQAPTWGSHDGPLVVQPATGTGVTLERWAAPAGNTGAMTVQTTPVASALPASTFLGAQAVDLPFYGWTAISWTNAFPDSTGEFEMIARGAVATTFTANGPYGAGAVLGASMPGRFFFSGLSPLGMPTTDTNGLYAADACSAATPALGTGTGCPASAVVAAWGDGSGPVATDSNGDVFAVMTSSATGMQEARGFLASSVAPGSAATAGITLFTVSGYSGSLAALAPAATDPGAVIFQQIDSTTNAPLSVVQQQFTTGSTLAPMGTPTSLLTVPSTQTQGFSFLVDRAQRLWVAVNGATSTTYVVLVRRS
jgi:hypothetical protein